MGKLAKVLHVTAHVVMIGAQYANLASGLVPSKYQPLVAAAVALAQAVHGLSSPKVLGNARS